MNFIIELPSFDMFLNTPQTQELLGTIEHTTPRSHTITHVPQSLQQVSSTSSTHRSVQEHESTHHTAFKS